MRLFVSLPLDDALRKHAAKIPATLLVETRPDDIRWVPPENLHVTLNFLGEVPDGEIPQVLDALRRVPPCGRIPVVVAVPDADRHRGNVHVIAAEVEDPVGALHLLHASIDRELERVGFARERRRFWPHVTIGRSRRGVKLSFVARGFRGLSSIIDRFELMSSTLGRDGPRYEVVARFPIASTTTQA